MKHTLDATGKKPGRLASEIAVILMGKDRTDFAKNRIPAVDLHVENAGKMVFDAKKLVDKIYVSHSGYPGALKSTSMQQVITKKGGKEVLRKAIMGMLPKNKLRAQMMKNLTINE